MKVYFTTSTKSLEYISSYVSIALNTLKQARCTNLNAYIEQMLLVKNPQLDLKSEDNSYSKSLSLINKSQLVIADVTIPSITIGRQIEYAIQKKIMVLCLMNTESSNQTTSSLFDTKIDLQTFRMYNQQTLSFIIKEFIQNYNNSILRINFLLPKELDSFLNWLSQKEAKSKSEILRELIEKEKNKHPDFTK